MNVKTKKYLLDIFLAIKEIDSFIQNDTFFDFQTNRLLQKAIEREFEIIGEALNRIKKIDVGCCYEPFTSTS